MATGRFPPAGLPPADRQPASLHWLSILTILPVAVTVFPNELYRAPETWARRALHNLVYFHEVDKGGQFAAWEQPEFFSSELRAAFKSVRTALRSYNFNRRLT